MSYPARILFQSLVKSFYRENAGAFLFFFTVLFFIVGDFHGAGIIEYHYSLITGILENNYFLLFVCFAWLLYARKCATYVSEILYKPEYAFLHILNYLGKTKRYALFFFTALLLLLPVLLYACLIIIVGWKRHFYATAILLVTYLVLLCAVSAARHVHQLNSQERIITPPAKKVSWLTQLLTTYPLVLIRFIAHKQLFVWLGIKIFTCGILYAISRNNTLSSYDFSSVFWFFNFGIIANGILVYRIREFETSHLAFYRGVPVSLPKRLLEYSLVYFMLLLPELITLSKLVPVHLHYRDAGSFALSSYSLLLFLHSITFLRRFSMSTYLKIVLLIACIQFIFLIFASLTLLSLLFFLLAILLFLFRYYRFE